ncbi:MAG: sterol desaturase family protein [Methylovulum sp.]|nr:sterol desaturase family protein [Methylovulum sp.]
MENLIRLTAALGIFSLMIAWEYLSPRRLMPVRRKQRWPVNLGLAATNMLILRISVGGLAGLSAVTAAEHGYGLLNLLAVPGWLAIIITLLGLDIAIYGQHIAAHKWPVLWRLHQIHHTDMAIDATTAIRFHPLEILLSLAYKVLCIALIGAHPLAVMIFEIMLNGAATFNHSNIQLSPALDNKLRRLIVTPDMHRIHHSTLPSETDSNYGFSLSCWDRLFRTYKAEPSLPQTIMPIGLPTFRNPSELGFWSLLVLPFKPLRKPKRR